MNFSSTTLWGVLLALAPMAQAAPDKITSRETGAGAYELTLITDATRDVQRAQALLEPKAQALCGGPANVVFGRYSFQMSESLHPHSLPTTMTLRQNIHCASNGQSAFVPAPPPPVKYTRDDALIAKLSMDYLAHKDAGRYKEAYASFTAAMRASTTFAGWSEAMRQSRAGAGELVQRRIKKVSWYENPPAAPAPGVYVAADYVGEYANIAFHCGYIVWHLQADGGYKVMREESNNIGRAEAAKMTEAQLAEMKSRFRC